jgi:ubiquinone/menaquinone biosynthesis C-methylase UbiE
MRNERLEAWATGLLWLQILRSYPDLHREALVEACGAAATICLDPADLMSGDHADVIAVARTTLPELSVTEGYAVLAETYGAQPNPLTALEEPLVRRLTKPIPRGTVLDAGCGNGRHARHLAHHRVIGVDISEDMLIRARSEFPAHDWRSGDLRALPVEDNSVDWALSSLAMSHIPRVSPAVGELARVVRDGGIVIVTDIHPMAAAIGGHLVVPQPDGSTGLVRTHLHSLAEYEDAFQAHELRVQERHELTYTEHALRTFELPQMRDLVSASLVGWPGVAVWKLSVGP